MPKADHVHAWAGLIVELFQFFDEEQAYLSIMEEENAGHMVEVPLVDLPEVLEVMGAMFPGL